MENSVPPPSGYQRINNPQQENNYNINNNLNNPYQSQQLLQQSPSEKLLFNLPRFRAAQSFFVIGCLTLVMGLVFLLTSAIQYECDNPDTGFATLECRQATGYNGFGIAATVCGLFMMGMSIYFTWTQYI